MPWELAWYADRKAIWLPYDLDTLKTISKTLKPSYVILSGKMYVPYKDMIWMRMLNDSNYAKSLGYRLESVILFQNITIVLMYKTIDSSDAL